jgi:hypothetical protein
MTPISLTTAIRSIQNDHPLAFVEVWTSEGSSGRYEGQAVVHEAGNLLTIQCPDGARGLRTWFIAAEHIISISKVPDDKATD